MRTLDTHLVGVTTDQPHPQGYRPDLPLRSEVNIARSRQAAYDDGYAAGKRHGSRLLCESTEKIAALQGQLAATIGATEKP